MYYDVTDNEINLSIVPWFTLHVDKSNDIGI